MITKATIDSTVGITSEKAVAAIGNRYDLILIASRRVRELHRGDVPRVPPAQNATVTALLEIEAGKTTIDYLRRPSEPAPRKTRKFK